MVQLVCLMDDKPGAREGLSCEHGLSVLLTYGEKRILLDCGTTGAFLENAEALGISLAGLDAVVLSHSHYDHASGFTHLACRGLGSTPVYVGPEFFRRKMIIRDGKPEYGGPQMNREDFDRLGICRREVNGLLPLFPGLWLLSGFPRRYSWEVIPSNMVLEDGSPDDFRDEVCIVAEHEKGLVLLSGCAHPGIVNMCAAARSALGRDLYAVLGGTHLRGAPVERLERTVEELEEMGVKKLGFSHCSGETVCEVLRNYSGIESCRLCTGDTLFL